jgi:medium-chain acyl-[acyl-carrier-protein] hydrolase
MRATMTHSWHKLAQTADNADYNLICLPFAGGFAEYYLSWRHHLSADTNLCPVQLPGRSYLWQETAYTDMQPLLNAMLPALTPLLTSRPYILFGHSMGGYIAYEFCKRLKREQLPLPEILAVSSVPAPQYWRSRKMLSELTEQEFYHFFIKLGGFPPEILKHEAFVKMQMSLLRSDIMLCESCVYQAPAEFTFPVIAMGGNEDEYVMMQSMAAWQAETSSDFSLHEMHGHHFYLNEHLPAMLQLIKNRIGDHAGG